MIRSLLIFLLAALAMVWAGSASAIERPFRFLGESTSVFADTLAAGVTDTTYAQFTDGCDRMMLLGAWAGADSVSVTIQGSLDAVGTTGNWYTILSLPLVSDAGNGAFGLYLNESLSSHKTGSAAGAGGHEQAINARFVRLIITNGDDATQAGNGAATKLTLTSICVQ